MAPLTIVALGDSLTQGFQHGAMHRPDWSFPAILARSLGLSVPAQHRVPEFLGAGHPLNLEHFVRHLERELGPRIETGELLRRLPRLVPAYLDEIEDFYERGPGSKPSRSDTYFHNLAAWGFRVGDALRLTPRACAAMIEQQEGRIQDDPLGLPCAPMYRSARQVLNPASVPARDDATMLGNLRALAAAEPIDVVTLWLGSNDCLATVLEMHIEDTPRSYVGTDPIARRRFNLSSAAQFHEDYDRLLDEIAQILAGNPGRGQVYVGTVPHVTILPLTNGLGRQQGKYYERYGRFFRNDANRSGALARWLTREQVIHIDERIDLFNASIRSLTAAHGWRLVDIAATFDELAVKRNDHHADPGRPLRDYLGRQGFRDHPLLALERLPSILAYTVETGPDGVRRKTGGLVGLDQAHPSTVGYGLMAERFLQEIQAHNHDDALLQAAAIDWGGVLQHDTLENDPPALWADMMNHAERCAWLWEGLSAAIARHVT
ncbi:SGNH/GDSL hydrolase family protein [Enhygromyxa salina]|uniref:GDSL-like Lipase/Acylhydrolase n=1 Tax=Enhygromyxa salina TaxID=215803 RepID=A0A2S9YR34_9BACT|nr:SGNH/GDSL hydrolase family protein [Enhygromyxa salina]PRQ07557.1 GDSL-like Lipase/Acylhydrolase [Enhygromyxa salina]